MIPQQRSSTTSLQRRCTLPRKRNTAIDVFRHINMMKGDHNVCWEWTGRVNKGDGRPYFRYDGKRMASYVCVYELHSGKELEKSQVVRHSCDNPVCCNPFHLSIGSHQENMNDMVERERHGLPKIAVKAIKKLREEGKTQKECAALYGVSREAVSAIDTMRTSRSQE